MAPWHWHLSRWPLPLNYSYSIVDHYLVKVQRLPSPVLLHLTFMLKFGNNMFVALVSCGSQKYSAYTGLDVVIHLLTRLHLFCLSTPVSTILQRGFKKSVVRWVKPHHCLRRFRTEKRKKPNTFNRYVSFKFVICPRFVYRFLY